MQWPSCPLPLALRKSELLFGSPKRQPQHEYGGNKFYIRKLITDEIKLLENDLI
jgi:hypothetical protein